MSMMKNPDDDLIPIHGLRMEEDSFEQFVDLAGDTYHYEMVDGIVYNMADPSIEHGQIASNIRRSLEDQIGFSSPCRVVSEYRVKIPDRPSVKPDVLVTCDRADWSKRERARKNHRIHSPLIVVEILSPSTRDFDRTEKFTRYTHCSTLQVYILVEQDSRRVEIYQRQTGWAPEVFSAGQTIHLDPLDLELSLDEIYRGVFEDDEA